MKLVQLIGILSCSSSATQDSCIWPSYQTKTQFCTPGNFKSGSDSPVATRSDIEQLLIYPQTHNSEKFPEISEGLVLQALSTFAFISWDVRTDLMHPGSAALSGQRTGLQRVPLTPALPFIHTHSRTFAMETPPIQIPTVPQKVKGGSNTNLSQRQAKPLTLHHYYLLNPPKPHISFFYFTNRPRHAKAFKTFTIKSTSL